MKIDLSKIKKIVEENPVVISTVMKNGCPNCIAVAFVKVVSAKEILITDNFMNQTVVDMAGNKNVCLLVWNKQGEGYKIIGLAKYYQIGKWKKFVEKMKENKGLPAKGAIVVKVSKVIKSC